MAPVLDRECYIPFPGNASTIEPEVAVVSAGQAVAEIIGLIHRIRHLKALREAKTVDSEVTRDVGVYGARKVLRSVIERIYGAIRCTGSALNLTDVALDIAAACSMEATEVGKIVTLSIRGGFLLIEAGKTGVRSIKGCSRRSRAPAARRTWRTPRGSLKRQSAVTATRKI